MSSHNILAGTSPCSTENSPLNLLQYSLGQGGVEGMGRAVSSASLTPSSSARSAHSDSDLKRISYSEVIDVLHL